MVVTDENFVERIFPHLKSSKIDYKCEICFDSGYVMNEETRAVTRCQCAAQRESENLIAWKQEQRKKLRQIISQRIDLEKTNTQRPLPKDGMWIFGKAGTGKTHFACYALDEAIKNAREVFLWCYYPIRQLLDAWLNQYSEIHELRTRAYETIDSISACSVVVIDDIDKISRITPAREEELYSMFDILHSRRARLIVTSQISIDEFCKRMPNESDYIKRDGVGPQQRRLKEMCTEFRL